MIYIGADHRGFELKEKIKEKLELHNYEFEDLGANEFEPEDDYTNFALDVAQNVSANIQNKGVLLCGTGAGVCIASNKVNGIRAALIDSLGITKKAREDDDINILCLPADFIDENLAWELVDIFLNTEFIANEKHLRRLNKITEYENNSSN
ncbi:MAG: RpiB/LacA/LacB family sugar-phosphate isomerase [Patescibacteria group bacterium]